MESTTALPEIAAIRYVAALREGGSMPGLVEADDDGLYVLKFRGAGQGPLALVAEVIACELARALGFRVPQLALLGLDPVLGRAEPDPEIQELIFASGGLNVGVDFLPGALAYTPGGPVQPDAELAADVVWLDALLTNVDRSAANPNLLVWHQHVWLIDHGAALYLQHGGLRPAEQATRAFPQIADHVLLPRAGSILEADERLAPLIDGALLERVVALVPGEWFVGDPAETYVDYLDRRLRSRGRLRRRRSVSGQRRSQFTYAILRVVPRIERGECFNAGVVLYCQEREFLAVRTFLDERRLAALADDVAPAAVRAHLDALVRIAEGAATPGRSPRFRRRSDSAGSSRLRARSCSRPRCTPGSAMSRRQRSTTLADLVKWRHAAVRRRGRAPRRSVRANASGWPA